MTPPRLSARILVGPALRAQPDRRLVALAREGHEPAVEEVVRRYRPALVRYAATIVPPDRADDVVQDSIARALPALCDGDSELHLRPWLYTIVRNAALNNIRDAGPATDHLDENFDGVEQPPQALERREELAAVVAGVQALPDSQRDALVKREIEGRSHAEIGAAMGVSVAAARQLIHRGRLTLREGLGALIPMPVMRQLLDGLGAPAAAGTGAGGALAAKAAVGLLAVGGAVGAGVALHRHSEPPAKAEGIVAEADAPPGHGSSAAAARHADSAAHHGGRGGESGARSHAGAQPGHESDQGPGGSLRAIGTPAAQHGGPAQGHSEGSGPGRNQGSDGSGGGGSDEGSHGGSGGHEGSGGSEHHDGGTESGDDGGGSSGGTEGESGGGTEHGGSGSGGESGSGGDSGSGGSGGEDHSGPEPSDRGSNPEPTRPEGD